MGLSLKPQHLKRYKDVAVLLMKYGRSDLVKAAGLDPTLDDEGPAGTPTDAAASELANDLERMGPTFIKLGQLLSTRPDILPLPYLRGPHAAAGSRRAVLLRRGREHRHRRARRAALEGVLRVRVNPVAAASLGQVHQSQAARRTPGRRQGPAARHPRAGHRGPGRARGDRRVPRSPHRDGPPLRIRPDPRRVPAQSPARARLPPGGPEPDAAPTQPRRSSSGIVVPTRSTTTPPLACSRWSTSRGRRSRP